jgi:hypothetical protein
VGPGAQVLSNVNGTTIPTAANDLVTSPANTTNAPTNALDRNFRLPSQWRGTLSADYDTDFGGLLGGGWHLGADFLWSDVRDQVYFADYRVVASGLTTPDGRPRYQAVTSFADRFQDIVLNNTSSGRSLIGVARFDKSFDMGLSFSASYAYQDVKDKTPATSSTAGSNYANGAFFDGSGAAYGISNDQVRHLIKYGVTFDHAFFGDYKTNIALFGETRIGKPFSYTMQDTSSNRSPIFGNVGTQQRYLMYVPVSTTDPLVSYGNTVVNGVVTQTAAQTAANLDALINSSGLSKFRGTIAPRNAFNSPWFTKIDLHISQEIPTGLGGSRVTLFADVENVGNLINKNWGQIREYSFPYTTAAIQVQCLQTAVATGTNPTSAQTTANSSQACAQYRYTAPRVAPDQQNVISSRQSLYSVRVGARFTF